MTGRDAVEPEDVDVPAADDAAVSDDPLAAIVRKERGDEAIAAVRDAGVYDDERRIVEHDAGTIAVPVTEPPAFEVLDVVRQRDPERRGTDLEALLRERGWTDEELAAAPASWAVVGTVLLVDVPAECPDERAVGDALLELHREADTVLAREGVVGQTRDPQRRVIAGAGDTETVHAEHGVRYALDLEHELFSPGNKAERVRIGALVAAGVGSEPAIELGLDGIPDRLDDLEAAPAGDGEATPAGDGEATPAGDDEATPAGDGEATPAGDGEATPAGDDEGTGAGDDEPAPAGDDEGTGDAGRGPDRTGSGDAEHVFDMFAGVGYFALPAAVAGARVTAAEIDPDTFGYLVENAQLNDVGDRVAAYLADCSEVAPAVTADRVVMGHYDAAEYLDAAFGALRDGGVLHYHAVAHESELPDRPRERIAAAASEADRSADVAGVRRVKSYGEGVWHVVADARVSSASADGGAADRSG